MEDYVQKDNDTENSGMELLLLLVKPHAQDQSNSTQTTQKKKNFDK